MPADNKRFSHVDNFTGYMKIAADWFRAQRAGLCVLDLPAGYGLLTDALRGMGHEVASGDINRERPDYHYVDMAASLPFGDASFDAALCLEGVEHLVDPTAFIAEISRVIRPGGHIVLSTPNVMNFYSRLHFLFTGAFYQFNPAVLAEQIAQLKIRQRKNMSPVGGFARHDFGHCGGIKLVVRAGKQKMQARV